MIVQFFPLDIDYETKDKKAMIRLFGKTIDNKRICVLDKNFQPYFLAIPKKITNELEESILNLKEEDSYVISVEKIKKRYAGKDTDVFKIIVNHPKDVPVLRRLVRDLKDIESVSEDDILFVRRYLIDKDITPLSMYNVEGEVINEALDVNLCINAVNMSKEAVSFDNPKILSFDIETYTSAGKYPDSKRDPIISLAFYGENFKKVITWKRFKTEEGIIFVDSEELLIQEFKKTINEFKPDYLVGYFSDGFDLPYIKDRANKHGINLDIGLDNSNVKINKKGMKSAKITGIPHLDIFKFIKVIMSGSLQLESYDLSSVAKELINEEKIVLDFNKISEMWDNNKNIELICNYNLQDTELIFKIFKKILLNLDELTRLIAQPIYDVCRMTYGQLVEWYLIKKAAEFNIIALNKPTKAQIIERKTHTYQGAFVFEPKPGLHNNLVVFDFRSLYPTVLVAHNISPDTLSKSKKNCYETPEIIDESGRKIKYYFNYKEEGFIPKVIKEVIIRRNRIKELTKKEKDKILEARSYALKTLMNSSYGYMGFFGARFYCRECAASITAFGRKYILDVIKKAEKEKFTVVHGDTDSLAIVLGKKTKEDAVNFLERVNNELPSLMELELEAFYPKGIFVMKKSELQGAKKKYALIDERGNLKVRGFEAVRRDWSILAKKTQLKVLEVILKENNIEKAFDYVKQIINNIRLKKTPIEEMVIKTQLRKNIHEYDQIGPHVKVAERMKNKGMHISAGTVINYVVINGKGMIRDRARLLEECSEDDYDSEYYINNQIMPAVKMIFEAIGYKKDALLDSKEQSKLREFI